MTGWIVFASVILFFTALLFLPVNVIIKYDGEPYIALKILFLKLRLMPQKKKKIKLSKYSAKRFRKLLERDEKKRIAAEEKKRKKDAEKKEKKAQAKAEKQKKKESGEEDGKDGVGTVKIILRVIFVTLKRFVGHFRLDVCKIVITVGSSDAAKTGMLYGALSQAVVYILEALDSCIHLKYKRERNVRVDADFLSDKLICDIHVVFRLRLAYIFDTAILFLVKFIKTKLELEAEAAKDGSYAKPKKSVITSK